MSKENPVIKILKAIGNGFKTFLTALGRGVSREVNNYNRERERDRYYRDQQRQRDMQEMRRNERLYNDSYIASRANYDARNDFYANRRREQYREKPKSLTDNFADNYTLRPPPDDYFTLPKDRKNKKRDYDW
jgi:hypothetical protein